jgi:REP element-mobilizing transposase RayT
MKTGSYSKIYIMVVIVVKNRASYIKPDWEDELYKYITGIIKNKGQRVIAINGTSNHLHILIGMRANCNLSDLVREVKKSSNSFIKEKGFTNFPFAWQNGFGAFSYSYNALDNVIRYIDNQKEHHRKRSFSEEYTKFLKDYQVDYNPDFMLRDV